MFKRKKIIMIINIIEFIETNKEEKKKTKEVIFKVKKKTGSHLNNVFKRRKQIIWNNLINSKEKKI